MRIFIDFEFFWKEGVAMPEIMSVGMFAPKDKTDGIHALYAVSSEWKDSDIRADILEWHKENTLPKLKIDVLETLTPEDKSWWTNNPFVCKHRKTIPQIRGLVLSFVESVRKEYGHGDDDEKVEFWGDCCAYDYVLLTNLICGGQFHKLPKTWPYSCHDTKTLKLFAMGGGLTEKYKSDNPIPHHALIDAMDCAKEFVYYMKAIHRV